MVIHQFFLITVLITVLHKTWSEPLSFWHHSSHRNIMCAEALRGGIEQVSLAALALSGNLPEQKWLKNHDKQWGSWAWSTWKILEDIGNYWKIMSFLMMFYQRWSWSWVQIWPSELEWSWSWSWSTTPTATTLSLKEVKPPILDVHKPLQSVFGGTPSINPYCCGGHLTQGSTSAWHCVWELEARSDSIEHHEIFQPAANRHLGNCRPSHCNCACACISTLLLIKHVNGQFPI